MNLSRIAGIGALALLGSGALAQGWFYECIDPENMAPYTTDFATIGTGNALIVARMGVGGTVTYGGQNGPCYAPTARTLEARGRFTFGVGNTGSVQSDFDDNMALTMGFPADPVGSFAYAQIDKGLGVDRAGFGLNGLNGYFVGASNRYFQANWRDADVSVVLNVRVLGDAVRMQWNIQNLQADTRPLGLRWGAYTAMRTGNGQVDNTNSNQANSLLGTATGSPKLTPEGYVGWNILPTTKPARNEKNFLSDNPKFPKWVKFMFGQTEAWGTRIENSNEVVKDQTPVDQFLIGNFGDFQAPGLLRNNEGGAENYIRNRVFTDFGQGDPLLDPNADPPQEEADINLAEVAYAQVFRPINVESGGSRTIVNYLRSVWSVADYADPYTALLDAPRLVASTPGSGLNDLSPNPLRIVAYVDNQFAQLDKEVPLRNVTFRISLGAGLRLADGETASKTLDRIEPNQISSVEWSVEADGTVFGGIPYNVTITPVPGPSKVLTGSVLVAATPRLRLGEGPNLVSLPWQFGDSSLDQVLGLVAGRDYVAYKWDPVGNGYTPATSVERGRGIWIIPVSDLGYQTLNSAQQPGDVATGGLVYNLRNGWNLIGNPYQYPVPLSQLTAVAEDNPKQSLTWQDLITLGYVSTSLAFWERDPSDPTTGSYKYTAGVEYLLQPHTGYWLYVSTFKSIRLIWPPVFLEQLPNSGRGIEEWKNDGKRWRLQLAARTNRSIDAQNWVAVARGTKEANQLRIMKPPRAPQSKLELSIEDQVNGVSTRLAQAVSDKLVRKEWRLFVSSEEAGDVTLTWPNIGSVPKNVRFKLTDVATGASRDLRMMSGYTVRMAEPGVREFKLLMEPGGLAKAVIGNVLVGRKSRDPNAPFTISYTLSGEATTSIRIFSGSGKEVFTVSRGRADSSGVNTVSWAMRDNANRAVAPGSYRVEILAETASGERVRRIVPINVVR